VDEFAGGVDPGRGVRLVQVEDQRDLIGDRAQIAGDPAAFSRGRGPVARFGVAVPEVGRDAVQGVVEPGDAFGFPRGQPGLAPFDRFEPIRPLVRGQPGGVLRSERLVQRDTLGRVVGDVMTQQTLPPRAPGRVPGRTQRRTLQWRAT
jgi:hypothetical protein